MSSRLDRLVHRPLPTPPESLRRGPFRPGRFASPLRTERMAAWLGVWLGIAFSVCFLTGLLSHGIQHPPSWFLWPSRPVNLYRVTQGLHVATGLAAIPLLLAKLWVVYPKLFTWPPARDLAEAVSRGAVLVLVASGIFQLASGVLNLARWYEPLGFFFTVAHYWTAWLAIGALLVHVGARLLVLRRVLGHPEADRPLVAPVATEPRSEPADPGRPDPGRPDPGPDPGRPDPGHPDPGPDPGRPDPRPDPGRPDPGRPDPGRPDPPPVGVEPPGPQPVGAGGLSRRGFLLTVGAAAGVVTVATVGQTIAPLAPVSLLAPRRPDIGVQGLPVNRSAAAAGVLDLARDPAYRLVVDGPRPLSLQLADLQAMPQHTARLPITCVEGWSAGATWSGVRLRDLLAETGVDDRTEVRVTSLQPTGRYRASIVSGPHLRDPLTLLALRLDDEPLALDHGYPCRLIAPNRPGVLQTKWVARIEPVG